MGLVSKVSSVLVRQVDAVALLSRPTVNISPMHDLELLNTDAMIRCIRDEPWKDVRSHPRKWSSVRSTL